MLELQLNEIEKQWNNKGKNGENGGTVKMIEKLFYFACLKKIKLLNMFNNI